MGRIAVVLCVLSLGVAIVAARDEAKPPKDSVRIVATGCLDKRVLDASKIEPEGLVADVHDFHLSGKKDVMNELNARNKRRVIVTGWVRRVDLTEPGFKVGRSRIRIGPAASGDPMRPPQLPEQQRRIITMEVIKVEPAAGACDGK